MNKKLLKQIIRFIVIGIGATIIDYFCANLFSFILNFNNQLSITLAFIISVIFNYFLSKIWVFDFDKSKSALHHFVLFLSLSLAGVILNSLLFELAINYLFNFSNKILNFNAAKIFATFFVMVFNFITRKFFLERRSNV